MKKFLRACFIILYPIIAFSATVHYIFKLPLNATSQDQYFDFGLAALFLILFPPCVLLWLSSAKSTWIRIAIVTLYATVVGYIAIMLAGYVGLAISCTANQTCGQL